MVKKENQLAIYQSKDESLKLQKDFKKDQSVISHNIKNIFKNEEVDKKKQYAKNAYCKF